MFQDHGWAGSGHGSHLGLTLPCLCPLGWVAPAMTDSHDRHILPAWAAPASGLGHLTWWGLPGTHAANQAAQVQSCVLPEKGENRGHFVKMTVNTFKSEAQATSLSLPSNFYVSYLNGQNQVVDV